MVNSQNQKGNGNIFNYLSSFIRKSLFYGALALLCGCTSGNSLEDVLTDYQQRISRITEIEHPNAFKSELLQYPRHRDLFIPIDEVRISLLDFFSLDDCDLQILVAERNNAMGKVMSSPQILVYEHQFLVKLRTCLEKMSMESGGSKDWQAQLAKVDSIKSENMSSVIWNATFASRAFDKLFSLSAQLPEVNALPSGNIEINENIIYLVNVAKSIGNPELELNQSKMAKIYTLFESFAYGGALLNAMEMLTFHLNTVAEILEMRLAKRPLCVDGKPDETAIRLQTVFDKFYRGNVQKYLAFTHKNARELLTAINKLAEIQDEVIPEVFRNYQEKHIDMASEHAVWQKFDRAIKRHTAAWQAVFDQCGMMPN